MLAVVLTVLASILWTKKRDNAPQELVLPISAPANVAPSVAEVAEPDVAQQKFTTEVLPTANDFFRRVESAGVVLPFSLPIVTKDVTKLKYFGGPSNTICSFVVGGRNAFGYHYVNRDGKEIQGVHSFNRTGKDENGMPLNLDQLKADSAGSEGFFKMLGDASQYPPRSLEQTAIIAQQVLAAMLPQDVPLYTLTESWQEQAGTNALPFYAFVFPKKAAPTSDPANLMRDEIVLILKSTSSGLVLDYLSNTSIAFAGQKKPGP